MIVLRKGFERIFKETENKTQQTCMEKTEANYPSSPPKYSGQVSYLTGCDQRSHCLRNAPLRKRQNRSFIVRGPPKGPLPYNKTLCFIAYSLRSKQHVCGHPNAPDTQDEQEVGNVSHTYTLAHSLTLSLTHTQYPITLVTSHLASVVSSMYLWALAAVCQAPCC